MFNFDVPQPLLSVLSRQEPSDLLIKLVGLGLLPNHQDNHLRIATLIQLTIAKARGSKRATAPVIAKMLNLLKQHISGRNEDPSEDVFVTTVTLPTEGDFRIFSGNFPGSDFHLQRLLDAVSGQTVEDLNAVLDPCRALLRLSECVARRCRLEPYEFATGEIWRETWPRSLPPLIERGTFALFSDADLSALDIAASDLEPFILTRPDELVNLPYGANEIMARPLLRLEKGLLLPIPSLVSPAIRLRLASEIGQGLVPQSGVLESLMTWMLGRWLIYDLPLRGHRPLENVQADLDGPDFRMFGDYAHAVVRFDQDKVAHLIILAADWSEPPEFALHRVTEAPPRFNGQLSRYIHNAVADLSARLGSDRGMTLVVYDSPGWNVDFDVRAMPADKWFVRGITSSGLSMLFADPEFDLLALWKLLEQISDLEAKGVRIALWPDLVNYWSLSREFGGTIYPPGVDLEGFGSLTGDTGAIQPWVEHVRRARAAHGALAANGEWEAVERFLNPNAPLSDQEKRNFLQPLALVSGELRNVVEAGDISWWIGTARPPFSEEEKQYFYLLWQTATEWARLLASANSNPLNPAQTVFELRLLPVPDTICDAPDSFELHRAEDLPVVTIIIPPGFIDRLVTVGNEGEVALVRTIAEAAALATESPVDQALLSKWVADVTSDPALKMMHVTFDNDLGMAVDSVAERAPLRLLQGSDLIASARGVRTLLPKGLQGDGGKITGKKPVLDCLNAIVEVRWHRCRAKLQALERISTLTLVSSLIEALHRDRVTDERAALARTRLYKSSPDRAMWVLREISDRDGAYRTYRTLAEMALCECPLVGGRPAGISDIDAMAAEILHLTATAEYSDAVKLELVPSSLEFAPDGSLAPDSVGAKVFMPEYLRASLQEVSDEDVEGYADLYAEPGAPSDTASDEDKTFFTAFAAEFGITFIDMVKVSQALQELAFHEQAYLISLTRSRLLERLAELEKNVDADLLERFLLAFGLRHRPQWDVVPEPLKPNDVWPWQFERRLSLMLKPVMILNNEVEPLILYGVRQLEMGMSYVSHLFENGIWPKAKLSSPEARAWIDKAIAKRGADFENEIAGLIEEAGWRTFSSVKMKRLGAPKALGEIDVLAVSLDGNQWLVIECKWFGAVRTAREVANWMQDYHGTGGDKLDHHLQRYAWICDNKEQVAQRLQIAVPMQITGRIVTTRPVPLTFTQKLPAPATVWTRRQVLSELDLPGAG